MHGHSTQLNNYFHLKFFRLRQEVRIPNPTSLDFELDARGIPDEFSFVEDVRVDYPGGETRRHIIFATTTMLLLLSMVSEICVDATFKVII